MSGPGALEKIELSGFKSIKKLDLEMRDLNILIGPNGSGKSNFINFFQFMYKIVQKDLQFYVSSKGGADPFLHFGKKETPEIKIKLYFPPNSYEAILSATQDDSLIFKQEKCWFHGDQKINYIDRTDLHELAAPGSKESGLPLPGTFRAPNHVARYLMDWKVYHFHDTSETAKVKGQNSIHDNQQFSSQGENLAAFLFSIQDKPAYTKIIETIQRMAPFFHSFILHPEKNAPDSIRLRWKHKGSDAYFDAHSLSDGTLRFICLTTLLLQPKLPTMILLDEPELGLHPYAIQLLGGMLKSAASNQKTQIIASTQSVTLANQLDWQDLIIVEQIDNASRFSRLTEENVKSWLDDYKIGDMWEKNLIGGTP